MSVLAINGGSPVHTSGWPNWPSNSHLEEEAVLNLLRSGAWWQDSMGESLACSDQGLEPQTQVGKFELAFARYHDCRYGVCTANGSVSLEVALRAAGVAPGDEVIVPPYTFIATAIAPLMIGAVPIFVDIEPDTCNIDPQAIRKAINTHTRAIIPVHFAGLPADMDAILEIAAEHGLAVVEDCAHAHGASYKGRKCGSLGDFGTFSFQGSKNITAGEGGIVITNQRQSAELVQSCVWGGRLVGSGWYGHINLATNLRMTEFQAAILLAQLRRMPEWFERRLNNGRLLDSYLGAIPGVSPMTAYDPGTTHGYHLYLFRYFAEAFGGLPKPRFIQALRQEGIPASGGYEYPLYKNKVFTERRFWSGGYPFIDGVHPEIVDYSTCARDCPVSEQACSTEIVWLPQSCLLSDAAAIQDVAAAIEKIKLHSSELL